MRIKKVSENLVDDISIEKIEEILSTLKKVSTNLSESKENLQNINSDLEKFTTKKNKNNDQLDDSVLNLERGIGSVEDLLELIDTISKNIDDYRENGRKYIY